MDSMERSSLSQAQFEDINFDYIRPKSHILMNNSESLDDEDISKEVSINVINENVNFRSCQNHRKHLAILGDRDEDPVDIKYEISGEDSCSYNEQNLLILDYVANEHLLNSCSDDYFP